MSITLPGDLWRLLGAHGIMPLNKPLYDSESRHCKCSCYNAVTCVILLLHHHLCYFACRPVEAAGGKGRQATQQSHCTTVKAVIANVFKTVIVLF
jgi:hypothetical protein